MKDSYNNKYEVTEENKFRPISAVNKRPDFILKKQKSMSSKTGKLDFPAVNNHCTVSQQQFQHFQDVLTKTNKSITGISKERLYEELLQYKNTLNNLRKELALVKSDNVKKSIEVSKKDKIIEEIVNEVELNPLLVGKPHKAKDAFLISSLKTQFKQLKNELETKTEEYENLKKHIKNTKFKELTFEINTLNTELNKLKNFYALSLQKNQANEAMSKDYSQLKEENSMQRELLERQSQVLRGLEDDIRGRDDEISKLKEELLSKSSAGKRLEKQLKNQKEINTKIVRNKDDNLIINNIKMAYEKQLANLNKEVNFFMNKSDKKDKEIRELKSQIKELQDKLKENKVMVNYDNINDIRNIKSSQEDDSESMLLLYKSKLKESTQEKSKMVEYIIYLESKLKGHGENFNSTYSTVNDKKFIPEETSNLGATYNYGSDVNFNKSSQTNNTNNNNNNTMNNFNNTATLKINNEDFDQSKKETFTKQSGNADSKSNNFSNSGSYSDVATASNEEFSYILIKNFEGYEITKEKANKLIFEQLEGISPSNKSSNVENQLKRVAEKIGLAIKISDQEEVETIKNYLSNILTLKGNSFNALIDTLKELILKNVRIYSAEEKAHIKLKLKKHLSPIYNKLIKRIKSDPSFKSNQITFFKLREILIELDCSIKDKYTEYLLSYMKSLIKTDNKMLNLDISAFKIIMESKDDDNENNEPSSDDSRITLSLAEKKLKSILLATSEYLSSKNNRYGTSNLAEIFKNDAFRPQTEDGKDLDLCIDLVVFIDFLISKVKYKVEDIDKTVIFSKYNLDEEYEVISIELIQKDLNDLGLEMMTFQKKGSKNNTQSLNVIHEKEDEDKLDSAKKHSLPFEQYEQDAEILNKALNDYDSNYKQIIDIVCKRTIEDKQEIIKQFRIKYDKDIVEELDSELSGNFKKVVVGLLRSPVDYDCHELNTAMKGVGTNEDTLIEILSSRPSYRIKEIKTRFPDLFGLDLLEEIKDETSGTLKDVLVALVENTRNSIEIINDEKLKKDVEELHKTISEQGNKEYLLNVLTIRSPAELKFINDSYYEEYGMYLKEALSSKHSGDDLKILISILEINLNASAYFAALLVETFKGLGTNDDALIRTIIGRMNIDLKDICEEFRKKSGKTLSERVKEECSGEYKEILLQLLNESS